MKKAILILHGFGGSPKSHDKLIEYIRDNSKVDPFIFTMPGHGDNEICHATRKDYLSKSESELQRFIDLGYEDITVYGFSMGGSIATYLATVFPEITRLIIAAPSYAFPKNKEKKLMDSISSDEDKTHLIEKNARLSFLEFLRRFPIDANISFLNLRKFCNMDVPLLDKPTLYLHGDIDYFASKTTSFLGFLQNKNINRTYVTLNGASHDMYDSEWEELIYSLICKYANGEIIPLGFFEQTDEFIQKLQLKR